MIKIQRNNKNKYYFCNFRKKIVGFYCFTTSPWRTQASHFNKIHLHIIMIIQPYISKRYFFKISARMLTKFKIYVLKIKYTSLKDVFLFLIWHSTPKILKLI